MRKIQAGLFMTLNGVVHNPGTWSMPYFSDDSRPANPVVTS